MQRTPICPECNSSDVVAPPAGEIASCQACGYFGPAQHFFAAVVPLDRDTARALAEAGYLPVDEYVARFREAG